MCQAYPGKTPSELYGVLGAAGLCFDTGIFAFARWVEGEMQDAEAQAQNEMFARSNRARAFARCMGDDMETSTAGYADPFGSNAMIQEEENPNFVPKRRSKSFKPEASDEVLWSEGGE
jgi:hypothetical protein